ncbi:MAG: PKD domain-containing protein, partial [Bacteroidetes bacterium]
MPLVQAFISGVDTICSGDSTVLTALDAGATPPLAYNWSGPGVDGQTTPSVEVNLPGTYCVTITDNLGCSSTTCKDLTVLNEAALNISYPSELQACPGDLVTFVPDGDTSTATFDWQPANLLDDPTAASPSFTFTTATTFTVTITSPAGCTQIQQIEVVPYTIPTPSFTVEQGCADGLEIRFNNTSSDAISYNWDFGDPTTTDDTSTEASPSYTYAQAGNYRVSLTATSSDGCTAEFVQTVSVSTLELVADFEVVYQECTESGSTVQFVNTSRSDYTGGLTYNWTFTNRPGSDLESPILSFSSNETITAILTVTTDNGCIASSVQQNIAITVSAPEDQFPESLIACRGESTPLVPAGAAGFTYTWSPTTGVDLSNPAQPIFSPSQTTTYTVVVSTGVAACDITETVEVIVPPAIGLEVSGDGVICTPTTTLNATTQQAANVEWLDPNTQDVLATGNSFTVDVSGVNNYLVVATDAEGCQESVTASVSGGPVDIEVPDTVAVCFGQEILLNVT